MSTYTVVKDNKREREISLHTGSTGFLLPTSSPFMVVVSVAVFGSRAKDL